MKKTLTSGLVLSMLIGVGSALADEAATALTTKNYVDTGLKAVYGVAHSASTILGDSNEGLVKDVIDLETTVGDNEGGLVKGVSDLKTTVGDNEGGLVKKVTDLETTVQTLEAATDSDTIYTAGTGISIDSADNNAVAVAGLAATTEAANQDKKYIYQNGVLTALDVENTWDPSILID